MEILDVSGNQKAKMINRIYKWMGRYQEIDIKKNSLWHRYDVNKYSINLSGEAGCKLKSKVQHMLEDFEMIIKDGGILGNHYTNNEISLYICYEKTKPGKIQRISISVY